MSAKCLAYVMLVVVAAACASQGQERIKMCGREFIRLALSTCGSSRLRRSVPDAEANHHRYSYHWDEETTLVGAVVALESDGKSRGSSLAAHWLPVSPRTRRDVGKISDICCEKGCSLQELIQFC
ncbi:insulin-like 3 (Leydig cell) [Nelusetta ayraudi]|uniref:insulin-like 3 (Leydig cell) n=1 Tax=Nelusetta ayraudi TaxID=303726 RepID=UPI003F71F10A